MTLWRRSREGAPALIDRLSRRTAAGLFLAGAVAAAAIFYAIWLPHRPFTDEGSVCTLAQGLCRGQALYRDLTNEKAPGQYVLTGIFFTVLGQGLPVVRLVPALSLLAVVLLAGRLATVLTASRRAGVGAAAVTMLAAPAYQAFNNVAETTLAPIVLLSATVLLAPPAWLRGARWRFLALGALLGLGLWFKQTFAWGVLGFFAAPALRGRRLEAIGGAALCWGALLVLAWHHSGFALLESTVISPARSLLSGGMRYGSMPTPVEALLLSIHLALLVTSIYVGARDGSSAVPSAAVIAAALSLAAAPRMDMFRVWPAGALLGVVAAVVVSSTGLPRPRRMAATALAAWAVVCTIARPPWVAGSFGELRAIADEIVSYTAPSDTIWVGPHEPNIYCLAERRPASRFTYVLPWHPLDAQRAELLADLQRVAPLAVVDVSAWHRAPGVELRRLLPGVGALLDERYEPHAVTGGAVIYRLRETPTAQPR